jgi:NitT/TauT family transport system permease protein
VAIELKSYRLQRAIILAAQITSLIAFLGLWELAADHKVIDPYFLSKPTQIWSVIRSWAANGTLLTDVDATLEVLGFGYICGLVIGLILGVLIGAFKWFSDLLEPFVAFLNAIPRLILMPLFLVWFGFGIFPQILLVIVVIVFLVAINIATGVREVDEQILQQVRVMGGSRLSLFIHVYVPSIAVWIGATARVTVGYAFQAAIVAEFTGRAQGLGYLVVLGQTTIKVQVIYAAIAIMMVVAIVIDTVLAVLERRATRWMPRIASGSIR